MIILRLTTTKHNVEYQTKLDEAFIEAFLPLLHLPPPSLPKTLETISQNWKNIDLRARKRLDRGTLYQSLLLEYCGGGGSSSSSSSSSKTKNYQSKRISSTTSNRRYLDLQTTKTLRGALGLACQPRWRKIMTPLTDQQVVDDDEEVDEEDGKGKDNNGEIKTFRRGGIQLYSLMEDEINHHDDNDQSSFSNNNPTSSSSSSGWGFNNPNEENNEEETSSTSEIETSEKVPSPPPTIAQQETISAALAHSLNCGFLRIDDQSLKNVRRQLLLNSDLELKSESKEIQPAGLIDNLLRLAKEGKNASINASSNFV